MTDRKQSISDGRDAARRFGAALCAGAAEQNTGKNCTAKKGSLFFLSAPKWSAQDA